MRFEMAIYCLKAAPTSSFTMLKLQKIKIVTLCPCEEVKKTITWILNYTF